MVVESRKGYGIVASVKVAGKLEKQVGGMRRMKGVTWKALGGTL